MRIAYLISQYPAASHTFIRREVDALRARGVEIDTFSIREPSPGERTSAADKAAYESTYYALPPDVKRLLSAHATAITKKPLRYLKTLRHAFSHRVPGAKALVWSMFHFGEAIVLAQEMEKRQIGHVHNHFANSGANVGFLVTRFLGVPWSLTLHGHSETDYPAGPVLPAKLEAADFIACISYYGMAQAMRIIPPDHWKKFLLMRCALDLSKIPARTTEPRERPRFVCVARMDPEKGQYGLLGALAKVRARGADADLVLVGDGVERPRIEQRIADLGLGDRVQLRGRLAEVDTMQEIAKSDFLVLPSMIEGLPVVLMEAMALGLPVIGPRVAGVPELVKDGVHGLLFAPAAWDELAECLYKMITDADLRTRLSQGNRARIEEEFEITKAVQPLEQRFGTSKPREDAAAKGPTDGASRQRAGVN